MSDGAAWSSWSRWLRRVDFRPGDHFTIIGGTGSGKTYLAERLLERRRWVSILATKPRDRQLDAMLERLQALRLDAWPPPRGVSRVAVWPRLEHLEDADRQAAILGDALDSMFSEGAWTVYLDEVHYAVDRLGLGDALRTYWQQGRALGLSVVAAFQRPAHVPLEAYSQAQHLAVFRASDHRDRQRLGEVGGHHDRQQLERLVASLPPFAFAHVDVRSGEVTVTRAPDN